MIRQYLLTDFDPLLWDTPEMLIDWRWMMLIHATPQVTDCKHYKGSQSL